MPEGLIKNFDGVEIESARPMGVDINRNYGANWQPDSVQQGAALILSLNLSPGQ